MPETYSLETIPAKFELVGPRWAANAPLWSARVKVLSESLGRAARPIYNSSRPRDTLPGPIDRLVHFPGTLHVRVRVEALRLRLGDPPSQEFAPDRPTDVTMFVAAEPERWGSRAGQSTIDQMVCIAGQFPLSPFFGPNLERLPDSFEKRLKGVFPNRIANLFASSSGFILDGKAKMPDRLAAFLKPLPFLLEVARDETITVARDGAITGATPADGTFVIRIDRERLSEFPEGGSELLAYFQDLVQRLNPGRSDDALLKWLRLELTDPTRVPDFYWKVRPSDPNKPQLLFAPGEWKLFVSDQALHNPKTPTRGVLAGTPDVVVTAEGVTAEAKSKVPNPIPNGDIRYEGLIVATDRSQETIRLTNVRFGYDAIDAASRLRAIHDLPVPRVDDLDAIEDGDRLTGRIPSSDGKIDPSVLWGFMPLADGCAQLPFLNLTEQLLIDGLPPLLPGPSTPKLVESLFRGAALFGTDRTELFDVADGRTPWNLAVLDADSYRGVWQFQGSGQPLKSATLTLVNPEMTAEGLFVLKTAAPTPANALPTLDDWVGGITTLPLKTPLVGDPYPSAFLLNFMELTLARASRQLDPNGPVFSVSQIATWDWVYEANPIVHKGTVRLAEVDPNVTPEQGNTIVDREFPLHVWLTALPRSRYPLDRVWGTNATSPQQARSALVWRRHPSHPCVQVLPLTQNTVPANAFSASRQLSPFGLALKTQGTDVKFLVPDGWRFIMGPNDREPHVAVSVRADINWSSQPRLVLAALGFPGAALGAASRSIPFPIPDSSGFLDRFLYRHDLPLLDQPNALADVPPESGAASNSPVAPPKALQRTDYAKHWAALENKAVLAEIDEAAAAIPTAAGIDVRGLMEPRLWPAKLRIDWGGFPGSLTFIDQIDPSRKIELIGDDASRDALRGFDGGFDVFGDKLRLGNPTTSLVRMVAGAFTAIVEPMGIIEPISGKRKLRDQRGLLRGETTATASLLSTPLILAKSDGDRPTMLCSFPAPVVLQVPGAKWRFWVKGLPTEGNGPFTFERTRTASPQGITAADPLSPRRGVNDPAADSRDLGHLNGYEWRLGLSPAPDPLTAWLPLGGFRFYPLSLEQVKLAADGKLSSARILGRLQLPAWNGLSTGAPSDKEFVNRDSAVELIFENGQLADVRRAPNDPDHGKPGLLGTAAWPLTDSDPDTNAPAIFWNDIHGERDLAGALSAIVLKAGEYRIVYSRQGIVWTVEGNKDLRFRLDGTNPEALTIPFNLGPTTEVGVETVTLSLDLTNARHRLTAAWVFRIGAPERLQLQVRLNDELLYQSTVSPLKAQLVHRSEATDLTTVNPVPSLDGFGLSVTWSGFAKDQSRKQLLPGFHLAKEDSCRGFGMLTFGLTQAGTAAAALPQFELRGGYVDILFACNWGKSLQEPLQGQPRPSFQAAFDSSAGRVLGEYHTALAPGSVPVRWPWELSLSGVVEVKNLISWPAQLVIDDRQKVTIPSATDSPWHHWRHTANILLSEHRIREVNPDAAGTSILVGGDTDDCFLNLRPGTVWMTPATVEHQLVRLDVAPKGDGGNPSLKLAAGEIRWTAVQEVRFCDPKAVYNHLVETFGRNVVDPVRKIIPGDWLVNSSGVSLHGLHSRAMLAALQVIDSADPPRVRPFDQSRLKELGSTLIVDATVPLFLRVADKDNRSGTSLLSAPGGVVSAGMSALTDFGHDPRSSDDQWLFLPIPFLGRLQVSSRDTQSGLFATDPVKSIADLPGTGAVPILLRALTNRGDRTADTVTATNFDRTNARFVRRLDPSSVADAWFRLLLVRKFPPPAPGRDLPRGITSAAASDSAAVSARPPALVPLFDPRRPTLPPRTLPLPQLGAAKVTELVWTPESLAVLQTRFEPELTATRPYAFLTLPLALVGSKLLNADRTDIRRHASATLLPTPPLINSDSSKFQPVSLALCPFTAVGYRPWPLRPTLTTLLTTAELMVFDASRARVEGAFEQVIHPKQNLSDAADDVGLIEWAQATVARLAADSPTAILRIRKLHEVGDKLGIEMSFRFLWIPVTGNLVDLTRRATAIRTAPDRVRHPQGQYGGPSLPPLDPTADFELAPPLVRGMQPLRLLERPTTSEPKWPWGLSGLRIVTAFRRLASADVGTVGASGTVCRVWWHAPAFRAQFAVPGDRQLLPRGFRAAAISGFLPIWSAAPLPQHSQLTKAVNMFGDWSPVLPGRRQILVTGLRPGAPYAFRESITTQTLTAARLLGNVVSASVPVQHRAPRPVLLPKPLKNRHDIALRTWGSWFDLLADEPRRLRTVSVSAAPEAEFSLVIPTGGFGQRVVLRAPTSPEIDNQHLPKEQENELKLRAAKNSNAGELPRAWNGELSFLVDPLPESANTGTWGFTVTVVIGDATFGYHVASSSIMIGFMTFHPTDNDARTILERFAGLKPGQPVFVRISAKREGGTIQNYIQSETLTVRVAGSPFPSHLTPRFLTWEDPEYNRRLASLTARKEKAVPIPGGTLTLALVADRREYNPTGKISYALVGPSTVNVSAKFTFFALGPDGTPVPTGAEPVTLAINTLPDPAKCELANIGRNKPLKPGDALRIRMTATFTTPAVAPVVLELDVAIVALPVTPVPDAAYAVLRRTGTTDECVRFAWGPDPTRIELLDPDDLLGQIVRRRAIFTTTDTVNRSVERVTTYSIQKTTAGGGTHFPPIDSSVT